MYTFEPMDSGAFRLWLKRNIVKKEEHTILLVFEVESQRCYLNGGTYECSSTNLVWRMTYKERWTVRPSQWRRKDCPFIPWPRLSVKNCEMYMNLTMGMMLKGILRKFIRALKNPRLLLLAPREVRPFLRALRKLPLYYLRKIRLALNYMVAEPPRVCRMIPYPWAHHPGLKT